VREPTPSITWDSPEDAERTWIWDAMHAASPLAPIQIEAIDGTTLTMGAREIALKVIGGYTYRSDRAIGEPAEDSDRSGSEIWAEVSQLCQAQVDRLLLDDYAGTPARELLDRVESLQGEADALLESTMRPLAAIERELGALIEFCEQAVGNDGARLAAEMGVGEGDSSSAAGAALGELALEASEVPVVRDAILSADYARLPESFQGEAFLVHFHAAMEPYAFMASSWGDVLTPTWAERPETPLSLIRRYLRNPAENPLRGRERARSRRGQARETVNARVPAHQQTEFSRLVASAAPYQRIREERARYQLIGSGIIRRLLLALGERLVEEGRVTEPDDVFFLYQSQVQRLLDGSLADCESLVASQRAEYERWRDSPPRPWVGAEPAQLSGSSLRSGPLVRESADTGVIAGMAASGGDVTGTARVLLDIAEASRVQPGDILVCRMTAAPWTPLFASVAAVVTDTGGVLCHSAIVAREYGIPSVVGTVDATRVIQDGDRIRVDGDRGIVTIL
jgi:phosphohistidine swiveling domain-containing protein